MRRRKQQSKTLPGTDGWLEDQVGSFLRQNAGHIDTEDQGRLYVMSRDTALGLARLIYLGAKSHGLYGMVGPQKRKEGRQGPRLPGNKGEDDNDGGAWLDRPISTIRRRE